MTLPIVSIVESYLPVLITAGDYAHRIQSRITGPEQKSGMNEWTQALTDADLNVQTFFEVVTLAHHPEFGFFGEESAQSANTRYFPTDTDMTINLDPINGTFLYKNQRPGWDIVMSIAERGRLQAAISYMPVRGRFYLAIRDVGALTCDRNCLRVDAMQPLKTTGGSGVCMTYRANDLKTQLAHRMECFDIVDDYDPVRDLDNLNDLFTGRLDAFVCRDGDLLDWGAAAFIAASAGGCATHTDGTPFDGFDAFDPERSTDMLVSTSPQLHETLLRELGVKS